MHNFCPHICAKPDKADDSTSCSTLPKQGVGLEKKVKNAHVVYAIFVVGRLNRMPDNDDFFESISNGHQRRLLLSELFFVCQKICRLNVDAAAALVGNKVHFKLSAQASAVLHASLVDAADIHIVSSQAQFVENGVLHQMGFFHLPELKSGVAQTDIFEVILVWGADVFASFNVIAVHSR